MGTDSHGRQTSHFARDFPQSPGRRRRRRCMEHLDNDIGDRVGQEPSVDLSQCERHAAAGGGLRAEKDIWDVLSSFKVAGVGDAGRPGIWKHKGPLYFTYIAVDGLKNLPGPLPDRLKTHLPMRHRDHHSTRKSKCDCFNHGLHSPLWECETGPVQAAVCLAEVGGRCSS
jgi:hypothetical protein